jgi:nucleoside diphosphate kinase
MFSRTGLRIVGIKVFRFSLYQALDFYGPVEATLMEKVAPVFGQKAIETLEGEFGFKLSNEAAKTIGGCFGNEYAREQFHKILEFMSGFRPNTCPPEDVYKHGNIKCMILIYEGENAVKKIRDVLGPTDPLKAPGGTVRREFGSSMMVNTAHASDSRESYEKEKKIVKMHDNYLIKMIDEYLASI